MYTYSHNIVGHIVKNRPYAAASNGKAAVMVATWNGAPMLVKYAPTAVGSMARRDELSALAERAAAKLGYKRDRRCRSGWRMVD